MEAHDQKINEAADRVHVAESELADAQRHRRPGPGPRGVRVELAEANLELAQAELEHAEAEKALHEAKKGEAEGTKRNLELADERLKVARAKQAQVAAEAETAEQEEDQRIADLQVGLPYSVSEQIGGGAPSAAPPAPGAPVVAQQLRSILSFQPDPDRLPETMRALERAFDTVTEDGVTRLVYAPGGPSAPATAADVTGVQGSIYARARSAVDAGLPILDELTPLVPELADEERVAASRAIVSSRLRQLVEALGADEGPNVLLVDGLWRQLLGVGVGESAPTAPEHVDGELGELRDSLYLQSRYIDNLDEERTYTRFLTLLEHVLAIHQSWVVHRDRLAGAGVADFGQAVGHIRRILEKVSADVDEVERVLDDRMITRTERRLMRVEYEGSALYLQTTLDWIKRFVTEEAVHLLDVAGKQGALALYPTVHAMAEAAEEFVPPVGGFPTLYGSPLVKAATATLAEGLDEATRAIERVGRPPAVVEVRSRRGPSPAEELLPEKVLEPAEVTVVPSVKKSKLVLGVAIPVGGERYYYLSEYHRIAAPTQWLHSLEALAEERLEDVTVILRDPRGAEYPGQLLDVEAELLGKRVVLVAFYEFELGAASIEAAREEFQLVIVDDETGAEFETEFTIPISP